MCYPLYHLPHPPGHWKITLGVLFNLYILNSSLFCAFLFFSSVFSCSSILVFSSSWYPFHNSFLLFLNLWLSQKHHFHKCIVTFKRNAIEFQVYGYFTCMYTWATFCAWCQQKPEKGRQIPLELELNMVLTIAVLVIKRGLSSSVFLNLWVSIPAVLNNPVAGIT